MKLAFICNFWDSRTLEPVPLYREMGADEIDLFADEITDEVKAFVDDAAKQGIPVSSLSPRWGWYMRALQDPSEVERMASFVEAGRALGIRRIMSSCTFAKPETDEEMQAHFEQSVALMRELAPTLESAGTDLCIHTTTRPGILFGTVEGIDNFLQAVGSPRIKLLFCCGCISVAGWDAPEMVRHWRDAIGAVHLFNPHGRWGAYDEMRFDTGQLDMYKTLVALDEVGYDGVLIPHEYPAFSGPSGALVSHGWVTGYLIAMRQALQGRK